MTTIQYKKIGILGLGASGVSSYNFLMHKAEQIIAWDDVEEKCNNLATSSTQVELVPINDPKWQKLDMIIISPGVSKGHPIFPLASQYNILISSDIEIFLQENKGSKIIAISGTNGESTTTTLVGHILSENSFNYYIGGNIGLPVLSLPQGADGYILELSSFQLDLLKSINPDIAVLLNITPDHLDRYNNYSEYCISKEKLLANDTPTHKAIKIIGINSLASRNLYKKFSSIYKEDLITISGINNVKDSNIGYLASKTIICDGKRIIDNHYDKKSYSLEPDMIKSLQGPHNYENIAAAFAVCRALGVMAQDIIKHFSSFIGLAHRMKLIGSYGPLSFYNDSKATNTSSAAGSLSTLKNIFWLAGGILKEEDLSLLEKGLKNVKKAYLFGHSRMLLAKYLEGKADYMIFETMEEAFDNAVSDAMLESQIFNNNSVARRPSIQAEEALSANIVLAPACASFDQFKNFEDRGNKFIKLYNARFQTL